jgi:predicted transcriptional regulator
MFGRKIKSYNEILKKEVLELKKTNEILMKNFNIQDKGIITPLIAKKLTVDSVTEEKINSLIKEVDKNIRSQCSFGRTWSPFPSVKNKRVLDAVKEYYKSKGFDTSSYFSWK